MTWFDHWSSAAKASKDGKAVSDRITRALDGGRVLDLEIVKPLYGEPYAVYASAPGIKVHSYKLTARDVDGVKRWKMGRET
jgi:hypothetical protein